MKLISFKVIIPFILLILLIYINGYYEIFAINITDGQGIEKTVGSFRVMTFNVNGSEDNVKNIDKFKEGLLKEIHRLNPDILCIQELSFANYIKIHSSLDSIFGYNDSSAVNIVPSPYMILSKLPLRNINRYKCSTDIDTIGFDSTSKTVVDHLKVKMPVFSAEVEVLPGRWVSIFACHLRSSAYSVARRAMDEDSSWFDGIPLYYHNYKVGAKIRNYEADNLRMILDSYKTANTPLLIVGDFNDWSGSYCLETIRNNSLKDAWWEGGFGFGFTYDAWHLKLRLDHILYSSHFRINNVFVNKSKFSDHYPLCADFILK